MKRKKFEYGLNGLIVGIVAGILLGIGELNWIKRSQRRTVVVPVVAVTVLLTACTGYSIGSKIGKEVYIQDKLGIKEARECYYKEGRYWIGTTEWTDKRASQTFTIQTHKVGGSLCSSLNGRVFRNHGIPNANQQTVPRYHKQAVNEVFKRLIDGFVEGKEQELIL